jgi:hypothetical protein
MDRSRTVAPIIFGKSPLCAGFLIPRPPPPPAPTTRTGTRPRAGVARIRGADAGLTRLGPLCRLSRGLPTLAYRPRNRLSCAEIGGSVQSRRGGSIFGRGQQSPLAMCRESAHLRIPPSSCQRQRTRASGIRSSLGPLSRVVEPQDSLARRSDLPPDSFPMKRLVRRFDGGAVYGPIRHNLGLGHHPQQPLSIARRAGD